MSPVTSQDLGRLLVSVCRLHHTRADQSVDKIGLYRGQAILLITLSERDGMTHSEIADKLGISAAAATKVIKRMEQARCVQRRPDTADERVSRVYLLDKGRVLIAEIQAAFARLDQTMLNGLAQADLDRLYDLLSAMQANLQRFQT